METLEGRRLGTKLSSGALSTNEHSRYMANARRGSARLRDALWRLQGYKPTPVTIEPPVPIKKPVAPQLCPECHAPIQRRRRQTVAHIQQTVAAYYSLPLNAMTSADRRREITRARQVGMYLASELTAHSIAEIGRLFKRDHTTILHAIKATVARSEIDAELAFDVSLLRERLRA